MKPHLPAILSILTNIGLGIVGTTIGYLTVPDLPQSMGRPPAVPFGYPVVLLLTWCFCTTVMTPIRGPYELYRRFGEPAPAAPSDLLPPALHRPQPNHSRAITLLRLAIFVVIMLGVLMLEAAPYWTSPNQNNAAASRERPTHPYAAQGGIAGALCQQTLAAAKPVYTLPSPYDKAARNRLARNHS